MKFFSKKTNSANGANYYFLRVILFIAGGLTTVIIFLIYLPNIKVGSSLFITLIIVGGLTALALVYAVKKISWLLWKKVSNNQKLTQEQIKSIETDSKNAIATAEKKISEIIEHKSKLKSETKKTVLQGIFTNYNHESLAKKSPRVVESNISSYADIPIRDNETIDLITEFIIHIDTKIMDLQIETLRSIITICRATSNKVIAAKEQESITPKNFDFMNQIQIAEDEHMKKVELNSPKWISELKEDSKNLKKRLLFGDMINQANHSILLLKGSNFFNFLMEKQIIGSKNHKGILFETTADYIGQYQSIHKNLSTEVLPNILINLTDSEKAKIKDIRFDNNTDNPSFTLSVAKEVNIDNKSNVFGSFFGS